MGINIPAYSSLGLISSQFFPFFFFSANMNLTVFAGILLAVPMAAARRASLGENTMQAAGEADEPVKAMRGTARPARLVEEIMQNADEGDEPVEAMRGAARPARLVEKIIRAADEADEPEEAKRAKSGSCRTYYDDCKEHSQCCSGYCAVDKYMAPHQNYKQCLIRRSVGGLRFRQTR